MEIDANMKWGAVNGLPPATPSATGATPAPSVEGDSFASSAALEAALKSAPDIRPEAVAGGRDLVSNANYPSDDTIKQLSDFLATQLQSDSD
jgi:hypothetical protein